MLLLLESEEHMYELLDMISSSADDNFGPTRLEYCDGRDSRVF
jgi:hypothetical protein